MENTEALRAGDKVRVHESDAPEYAATVAEVQVNKLTGPDGPYTDTLIKIERRNGRQHWVRAARIAGLEAAANTTGSLK